MNAAPIQDRVRESGIVILDRLSPADFASREDRALFDQIQTALADATRADGHPPSGDPHQMPDATAEEIASDILDLRDTTTGRAIRKARVRTDPKPRGRPRR